MTRFVLRIYVLIFTMLMSASVDMSASNDVGIGGYELQDSNVVASLITCYPGPDVYELYGHTMLRMRYKNVDIVYNYGIFDFDTPNFIYRFVKGDTDYKVAGYNGAYLLDGYRSRKVVEQQLNLTPSQAMCIWAALDNNVRPENATYRYNYVYDNCATRPRDIVERVLGDKLHYGEMHDTLTFRQEMQQYNANYAWQQFGIDLVLGQGIDYKLTYREQMFVPMVLMQAFAEACVERDGQIEPLVSNTVVLNNGNDSGDILPPTPVWQTPITVAIVLLVITIALSWRDVRRGKVCRCFDSLLFGIVGVCGLLVFFLIFISTHAATSPNFNGFWLHPFAFVPAIFVWTKKTKKLLYFYHFVNFVVVILLLIVWPLLAQAANMAAFPLMLCIATRSLSYVWISREQCIKPSK